MGGTRGGLPLAVGELVAARAHAAGRGGSHRRGRAPRARGGTGRKGRMTAAHGYLALEDGTVLRGRSVGADGVAFGEAVFTTGMSGYQETVTDPSFAGQLVCFTTPMVGNYGVDEARMESAAPHAKAVLMRRLGGEEWASWLHAQGIVALDEIDTRSLTLRLRSGGAMRAVAVADAKNATSCGNVCVTHIL